MMISNSQRKPMTIRKITEAELEEVSSILNETALWLKNKGEEMWKSDQVSVQKLRDSYKMKEIYLGFLESAAVATMILQEEDSLYWPNVRTNESLFLHKLAVRREFAKKGLSSEMLDEAKSLAKKNHKKYVRLDCAADRPQLCGFYEMNGFKKVGEQILFEQYPTAYYEYELL
ncbi:GNAT family N-acetyltransferase [Paenibacillus eucommiae]|uniref:GNAT superfamily N-acetyltransferase n=1 Tax=Paenibacillus eucommiae TaxID=1355755 RepID=A0ABS4J3M1_9BACL|nr:GNAT family N-acetyltransferase [Paenibacillus eucommiae]MBP1994408.1 GNAT superfamily N-acetyltransferase [Paenibacillus eucommiae]